MRRFWTRLPKRGRSILLWSLAAVAVLYLAYIELQVLSPSAQLTVLETLSPSARADYIAYVLAPAEGPFRGSSAKVSVLTALDLAREQGRQLITDYELLIPYLGTTLALKFDDSNYDEPMPAIARRLLVHSQDAAAMRQAFGSLQDEAGGAASLCWGIEDLRLQRAYADLYGAHCLLDGKPRPRPQYRSLVASPIHTSEPIHSA